MRWHTPHVSWSEANFLRQTLEDMTVLHIDNLLGQIHGYIAYMYDGFLKIFTLSNFTLNSHLTWIHTIVKCSYSSYRLNWLPVF